MDNEGKKALLDKMRNYPFHAIFDRRGRKDSSVHMQNAHLVPYGIQSKSIGVDIFTDDVAIDHISRGKCEKVIITIRGKLKSFEDINERSKNSSSFRSKVIIMWSW